MYRKLFILGLLGLGLILQACGKGGPSIDDIDYSPVGIRNSDSGYSMEVEDILRKAKAALQSNLMSLEQGDYSRVKGSLDKGEIELRAIAQEKGWIDRMDEELGGGTVLTSSRARKESCSDLEYSEKSKVFERLEDKYHEHYFEVRTVLGKLQAIKAIAKYKLSYFGFGETELTKALAKSLIFFVVGEKFTVASTVLYTIDDDEEQTNFYNRVIKISGLEEAILDGAQSLGYEIRDKRSGVGVFSGIVEAYKEENCVGR